MGGYIPWSGPEAVLTCLVIEIEGSLGKPPRERKEPHAMSKPILAVLFLLLHSIPRPTATTHLLLFIFSVAVIALAPPAARAQPDPVPLRF
jgi:hypothetical protein